MIEISSTAVLNPFPAPKHEDGRLHPAVIILPGGGYAFTSPREAQPVATVFNNLDCTAFVLEYTTYDKNRETTLDLMLGEVERSIEHILENSAGWHLDPNMICLCGFSAGGHLAALAGNRFTEQIARLILCYPALDIGGEDLARPYSLMTEVKPIDGVSSQTPPTFLWHTYADEVVPVAGSYRYLSRLVECGVPCEAHMYQEGRHGLSVATSASAESPSQIKAHVATWTRLMGEWLLPSGLPVSDGKVES